MPADIEERIVVSAPASRVYRVVAQVTRLARWSPECFAVWVLQRREGVPHRFVGFNRRRGYVWFTTCRVVTAEPEREFAFDVSAFGVPVARWGYRFVPVAGGTEVTEYWEDRRSAVAHVLGRIFTGGSARMRPEINRAGMRVTLLRLRQEMQV